MKILTDKELSLLTGRDFVHGTNDCYSLVKDFYSISLDVELPNFARPDFWWRYDMNLYNDFFPLAGFKTAEVCRPSDLQYGDVILMAIKSEVPCHAAIYIGDGKILHHFYGRKSSIELYKSVWYNTTTSVLRHKDVKIKNNYVKKDLIEDDRIKHQLLLLRQRAGEGGNSPI